MRLTLVLTMALAAPVFCGSAQAASLNDAKIEKSAKHLKAQVRHSSNVLRFFSNRRWMQAPRRHTCYSLPSDGWTTVCLIARQNIRAHRWLRREAKERLAAIAPPISYLSAWICIHSKEGAWNANTGNGFYGGLQMNVGFMNTYGKDMIRKYGGYAHLWSPRDQIVVAERAHRSGRGFSPWPHTARMCGLL